MIKAEVSLIEDDGEMLHEHFEVHLTEKVNGNWLADLINKGLEDYDKWCESQHPVEDKL